MCGFVGYISSVNSKCDIKKAIELISHRGPDGSGIYEHEVNDLIMSLAHTRLSVIDLHESANQPFVSKCGNYIIVFNGEIYNYKELKANFLSDLCFRTDSDTEVLLLLYMKYGEKILNQLSGMFAFAIYNKQNNILFMARDQLGIKPLYYFNNQNKLIFSSEIKSIISCPNVKKEMDEYALYEFMLNSFVYEPHTGFKNIYKLQAGEFIYYDLKKNMIIEKTNYWTPQDKTLNDRYSISTSNLSDVKTEVLNSIKLHTVSDVPICLFFSGGVDSSLLLSELGDTDALVVKSESEDVKKAGFTDDYSYSKKIAKHFNKEIKEISIGSIKTKEQFLSAVKEIALDSEELIADLTFVPTMEISKKARSLNYKVALSGMGADELFAGYSKYKLLAYRGVYCLFGIFISFLAKLPSLSKKVDRFVGFCQEKKLVWQYTSILGYFRRADIAKYFRLYSEESEQKYFNKLTNYMDRIEGSELKKAQYLDIFGFLSHNFLVADKASMKASLELRVPLATKNLFEIAFSKKNKDLISMRNTKKPLRKMLYKRLPKNLVDRRKAGFHPPMDNIMSQFNCNELINIFEENKIYELLDKNYVIKLVTEHTKKQKNHTLKLFQLLYLGYWYKQYFYST